MPTTAPPARPLTEQERTAIAIAEAAYSTLPATQQAQQTEQPPPTGKKPVPPASVIEAPVVPLETVAAQTKTGSKLSLATGRSIVLAQIRKYMQDRAKDTSDRHLDIPGVPSIPLAVIQQLIARRADDVADNLFNSVEEVHQAHGGADLSHLDPDIIKQVGLGFATQAHSESALALAPEVEKQTGMKLHKKWLSTMDGRTRPLHAQLHTNSVPLDEPFYSGAGGQIRYPGDPLAPLDQTINCRCHMIFTPADASVDEGVAIAAHGLPLVLVAARRVGRVVDRLFDLLHPRGRDGRFIEKNGDVDVFGLHGFQHGQRGQKSVRGRVVDIFPDPNDPDESIIRVEMTDPRWDAGQFGKTMDVHKQQIAQHAKPKGNIPEPTTPSAPPKPNVPAPAVPPQMAPTPGMTIHPNGPDFQPLVRPANWAEMDADGRHDWVSEQMSADLTEFRGEKTDWRMEAGTAFDPEIAFNLANRYRELTNWDPETAKRIDAITGTKAEKEYDPSYDVGGALAVAHPGTDHPGGIGTQHVKPAIITLKESQFANMSYFDAHGGQLGYGGELPFSVNGDPTIVLAHEFAHQRQFRFLEEVGAVSKGQLSPVSNQPWSSLRRFDGFDRVADSSNWDTTQQLRYDIQHNAPTEYGQTKSSEAYAESWAARLRGQSTPEIDQALDDWEARMSIPAAYPTPYVDEATQIPWEQATPEQIDEFWTRAGPLLDRPEMKERYPEATKEYNTWLSSRAPVPTDTATIDNAAEVDAYLAEHPQEPGEDYFKWQARIVNGLQADQQNAVLFLTREHYEPVPYIADGATRWREEHGLPEPKIDISEIPVPMAKADAVARAFEDAPDQSGDPAVQAAFDEFKKQSEEMWNFVTKPESEGGLGIVVEFVDQVDPYPSAEAQAADLRDNHHLYLQTGLGGEHMPTMSTEEYDRFRAVHDIFGHGAVGNGFDRHGEYQAYLMHSSMYWGDGRRAMASEYHGVNTSKWGGAPGSPGTGKAILLPEELIPLPWSDDGVLITASAPEIPGPLQLVRLNIDQAQAEALIYLAIQADIDETFGPRYEPMPLHPVPTESEEMDMGEMEMMV